MSADREVETPIQRAARLLREAWATADSGDAENALIATNEAQHALRVEMGEEEAQWAD